jgi:hypothetical protein
MKTAARIAAAAALALTIVPPLLFLTGALGEAPMKHWLVAGAVLWFVAWPVAGRGAHNP